MERRAEGLPSAPAGTHGPGHGGRRHGVVRGGAGTPWEGAALPAETLRGGLLRAVGAAPSRPPGPGRPVATEGTRDRTSRSAESRRPL